MKKLFSLLLLMSFALSMSVFADTEMEKRDVDDAKMMSTLIDEAGNKNKLCGKFGILRGNKGKICEKKSQLFYAYILVVCRYFEDFNKSYCGKIANDNVGDPQNINKFVSKLVSAAANAPGGAAAKKNLCKALPTPKYFPNGAAHCDSNTGFPQGTW